MKYCKKCGRSIKRGMSFCPYCFGESMKAKSAKQNSENPLKAEINTPSVSKRRKSKKLLVLAIVLSSVIVLGALFVVLDYTGVIPTGFFGGHRYSEHYIDDDGDARVRDTDEKIITETVEAENRGESD